MTLSVRVAESSAGSGVFGENHSELFEVSWPAVTCTRQQPVVNFGLLVGSAMSNLVPVSAGDAFGVTAISVPASECKVVTKGVARKPLPATVSVVPKNVVPVGGVPEIVLAFIAVADGE